MQIGKKGQNKDEGAKKSTKQVQGIKGRQTNKAHLDYQTKFPKISCNYTRYEPNTQIDKNTKHGNNESQVNARNNQLHIKNSSNNSNLDNVSEPAPYNVVQTFAA